MVDTGRSASTQRSRDRRIEANFRLYLWGSENDDCEGIAALIRTADTPPLAEPTAPKPCPQGGLEGTSPVSMEEIPTAVIGQCQTIQEVLDSLNGLEHAHAAEINRVAVGPDAIRALACLALWDRAHSGLLAARCVSKLGALEAHVLTAHLDTYLVPFDIDDDTSEVEPLELDPIAGGEWVVISWRERRQAWLGLCSVLLDFIKET